MISTYLLSQHFAFSHCSSLILGQLGAQTTLVTVLRGGVNMPSAEKMAIYGGIGNIFQLRTEPEMLMLPLN